MLIRTYFYLVLRLLSHVCFATLTRHLYRNNNKWANTLLLKSCFHWMAVKNIRFKAWTFKKVLIESAASYLCHKVGDFSDTCLNFPLRSILYSAHMQLLITFMSLSISFVAHDSGNTCMQATWRVVKRVVSHNRGNTPACKPHDV